MHDPGCHKNRLLKLPLAPIGLGRESGIEFLRSASPAQWHLCLQFRNMQVAFRTGSLIRGAETVDHNTITNGP